MIAIARAVGVAWAIAAVLQLVLWLVQQKTRNAGIVDVGWAASFAVIAVAFALGSDAPPAAWAPIAVVVAMWSVRLAGYLIARGAARSPEDGRYADLRARWGARASAKFFVFFQAQAALSGVLSAAFALPFLVPAEVPVLVWLGAAISAAGVLGEAIADAQLARWRRDPAHKGNVCDAGLWSWSRHPNYFFEWCVWVGYAVYGIAFAPLGLIALVPQAIIIASIFRVTGIPPTENQALRTKGDAYRAYQQHVSRFVPLPPKQPPSDS